jgi:hypothetical protein
MKKTFITATFILLATFWARCDQAADGFAWRSDLDQARAQAATEGKPLLIVFRCAP